MSRIKKPITRHTVSAPPIAQQQEIAEQTAAFLARGGKVQQIPSGVSGQQHLGWSQSSRGATASKRGAAAAKS
ncbi:MAG: hypothetical protein RBS88_12630 [Spongiibacteraceae bacterium]|jgi:hypothetical protein|nr:hypothetical protein [Spongiibacteraceae bacterium]